MLLRLEAPLLALGIFLSAVASQGASAYVGPATLSPTDPAAGQAVTVNVPSGICDAVGTSNSFPNNGIPQVTVEGTSINVLVYTAHSDDPEFCYFPEYVTPVAIGSFPAGTYSVEVDRWSNFFDPPVQLVNELSMTVGAASAPQPAPTLGTLGKGLGIGILLLLGCISIWRARRNAALAMMFFALCLSSSGANAQVSTQPPVIEVLVANVPGAPTPVAIVNYFSQHPLASNPPLQSLTVQSPTAAAFLMPVRATGDALAILTGNPTSPRALLEQYVVVSYPASANLSVALTALRADPYVQAAYIPPTATFSSAGLQSFSVDSKDPFDGTTQYGRSDLNIDAAWQLASGYALVGDIDTGLYELHPALAQFSSSGHYQGGNFLPSMSLDIGRSTAFTSGGIANQIYSDVDELDPIAVTDPSYCDPDGDGYSVPGTAGHGTHVAGLIAANAAPNFSVLGTCKHCGVAMIKATNYICYGTGARSVSAFLNPDAVGPALTTLADSGATVVNMSFGELSRAANFCSSNITESWCLGLGYAASNDVAVVAAAGNQRADLQFPANDGRPISAGGFEESLALWDDSPGSTTHCPYAPPDTECGSNYTVTSGGAKQELMASAHTVYSTTYPNEEWNTDIKCGDGYPTHWGGGEGDCTGTSMASPQIAGILGILRSVNPFITVGATPGDDGPLGPSSSDLASTRLGSLRKVLSSTTVEAQGGQPWSATFGFGHPDAAAAVRKVLGKVAGATVRNRVTPLFRLHNSVVNGGVGDYVDTTSPQLAAALIAHAAHAWAPVIYASPPHTVHDYPSFPGVVGPPKTPTATVYVLTTDARPRNEWPALVPLYLMDKDAPHSPTQGLNDSVNDFMLVTTASDIEYAHATAHGGYNLRNIQGYIYAPCTPEPGCIPPAAKRLYRACNSGGDCATFLETEVSGFTSYTTTFPPVAGQTRTLLGYAYTDTDTDGDGLVDGFEYVIGTNPNVISSNGDSTKTDGQRFPMIGLEIADPCQGGTFGASRCGAEDIFKYGFDLP